ncbi:MAG: acyl-CoA desaturase [Bacteroidota bacterium]|nr:acyl-CoA desaturase [Bacteroidota bacterium]
MATPKFIQGGGTFHTEIKRRVNEYFGEIKRPQTGDASLFIKAALLFGIYILLYIHLVFFTAVWWVAIPECIILGGITAAIGFNVMHDGGHGSFSKHTWLNKTAGNSLNFLGASALLWNMKHNILHHTYTNIDGVDDDIEVKPMLRLCKSQKRYFFHRFQHYYVWFLYTLLHILWIWGTDFKKYFKREIAHTPLRKWTIREHINFWIAKFVYAFIMVAVPVYFVGFVTWLIGFLVMAMVCGFTIAIVFQLAHTVEETEFPLPAESSGKIENEWAIHQVLTTANFATNNKVISWLVGGLNFQIEHHLFPRISHIHYPAISKIIKQACNEFGIKYNEFPKMGQAIVSHYFYIKKLGQAS